MPQKTITVRFLQNKPAEVYTQKPGGALTKLQLAAPLTNFTAGSLGTTPAEMSIQVVPWTIEYPSPLVWHLNRAWSLGQEGIVADDIKNSKPAGTTSRKDVTFDYDQARGTIAWTNGSAKGEMSFNQSSPGWTLILKQKDSAAKTGGIKVGENVIADV